MEVIGVFGKAAIQCFLEIMKALFNLFKPCFGTILELINLPQTKYDLVKFFCEKNIILFDNENLTKILLYIIPLIVAHVLGYFPSLFKKRNIWIYESLSIILYLFILILFSLWYFWVLVGLFGVIWIVFEMKSTCLDDDECYY